MGSGEREHGCVIHAEVTAFYRKSVRLRTGLTKLEPPVALAKAVTSAPWPEQWRRAQATTQGRYLRYLRADPCRYRCYNSAVEKPCANLQFLYTGGIFTRSVVSYPVGEWLSLVEHLVRDTVEIY
jgi:hypothetical protein